MSKFMNWQVIQDKDTNFVFYDITQRNYPPQEIGQDYVSYPELSYELSSVYIKMRKYGNTAWNTIEIKNGSLIINGETVNSDRAITFSDTLSQKDCKVTITPSDLYEDDGTGYVPEGIWEINYFVTYFDPVEMYVVSSTESYYEFAYKQLEMYRAELFEKLLKVHWKYSDVTHRALTEEETDLTSALRFDAVYTCFKQAVEVGNLTRATTIYTYLDNYKTANPNE